MTWWVALSAGVSMLLVLLAIGVPIFVSFLLLNVAGVLVFLGPAGFGLFAASIFTTANISALAAVPLFILMGDILFRSGAMEVLFNSLDRLIGRIRGRQYVLCILLSAILGALSGAAMAVAGMLGRSLFPSMVGRGYDTRLSVGTILGGASLDPIIPPSVLAIIIATLAQVSTGKLLVAGILPGLLLTGMFLVYVLIVVWAKPSLAPDVAADLADRNIKGSALHRGAAHAARVLHLLSGHGARYVRDRDADRSGRDRGLRRDRSRALLSSSLLEDVDRGRCDPQSPSPPCCCSSCAAPSCSASC